MIKGYVRAPAAVGHFASTVHYRPQSHSQPTQAGGFLWLAGLEWHVFFQPTWQTFVGTDPVGVATACANAADAWHCAPTSALCPANPQVTCLRTLGTADMCFWGRRRNEPNLQREG